MLTADLHAPEAALPTFQAFFSYAHADAEIDPGLFEAFSTELEKRASALLANGDIHIWRDTKKIRTGQQWDARIEEAVRNSQLLIVMLSPNWLQSDYCRKEYRIFAEVEQSLPAAEFVFPLLVYGVAEERAFLAPDQREVFDALMARQYKPTLAKNFLLTPPNEIRAQVLAVAEDMKAPINRLRRPPVAPPPVAAIVAAPAPAPPPPQIVPDISRIFRYVPEKLIGREAEKKLLDDAWAKARNDEASRPLVLTFVALGGEGKTSLVAHWAAELAYKGWPGCEAAFAWSFYSQGTREQMAASSDLFLKAALEFFGDAATAGSPQSAHDKGKRLAQLVGEKRALLILDGLEPLQYAPTSPTKGELKDEGLKALLKGLAQSNRGLCVVTTRFSISDLRAFWHGAAPEIALKRLSTKAGVALLRALGVTGAQAEYESLVEDVKGHALTLNLLGSFLRDAHGGDIRKRDLVRLEEADVEEQNGHAFRAMDAYAQWFESEGEKGRRALAMLRLLGLFDRPADAGCLGTLWKAPAIEGLTEPLVAMSEAQRNIVLKRLEDANLLTVNRNTSGALVSIDAHPLLREYFARELRKSKAVWEAAHKRLFEHLCGTTQEGDAPTLDDLQPLYQAVAHGCQAGIYKEACDKVYRDRILRGTGRDGYYSMHKLGAFGSDLGADACFFETPWKKVTQSLELNDHAWLLNQAAVNLRALGRLKEAESPLKMGLFIYDLLEDWRLAAGRAGELSTLLRASGELSAAIRNAQTALEYAEQSGDTDERVKQRAILASVMHQAGQFHEAETLFRQAEDVLHLQRQAGETSLISISSFQYCDLLLDPAEREAWRAMVSWPDYAPEPLVKEACRGASRRAAHALCIARNDNKLLDIAHSRLILGRATLYTALLEGGRWDGNACGEKRLPQVVDDFRRANIQEFLARGLLTRAWLRRLDGDPAGAREDLDEAFEIAGRGPMPLHLADVHLHRARLFGLSRHRPQDYPWVSPRGDLAEARRRIDKHGYGRRWEELEDAEAALRAMGPG